MLITRNTIQSRFTVVPTNIKIVYPLKSYGPAKPISDARTHARVYAPTDAQAPKQFGENAHIFVLGAETVKLRNISLFSSRPVHNRAKSDTDVKIEIVILITVPTLYCNCTWTCESERVNCFRF